ncbi:MAG: ABC transporter substrate-binding protein [Nitrospinaceae bacterium]|nr:ABC transporter substrate-binding protein [Nitrospinaceae bacterium]NIR55836.1 ABC transporter substrate-binding protein [Nitrospinaceae bacterium]NIS86289.1 ABC transporter substrate-binding protein [Nitrospinaceae bacterium]NIT83118.1 ABC transporter substrate-binding protein [Nitrospinaceae bacterium]NIU45328.1 ABC transporter substrate-binding protein [Nitrospinaceae bacterium]
MIGIARTRAATGTFTGIVFLFCALLWFCAAPAWAKSPYPQRIISMSPSITETLFALGIGHRVVGVTDFCSYPKEACALPKIGGLLNPSVETWIRLKPDLIIHQDDSHKLRINARNLGIPTLAVSMTRLDDIFNALETFGDVLGCGSEARELAASLKSGIDHYRTGLKNLQPIPTLLILGEGSSPGGSIYAAGRGTFLGELLELAGGENILTGPDTQYPKISKEFILRHSPEVIIEAGPDANISTQEKEEKLRKWSRFSTLTAVKNRRIYFIGADYILIPGPRFLNILDHFARVLHPEAFKD